VWYRQARHAVGPSNIAAYLSGITAPKRARAFLLTGGRNVELRAQRPPDLPRVHSRLERLGRRLPAEGTYDVVGDQHIASCPPELGQHQSPELRQPHPFTVEVTGDELGDTNAARATVAK